MTPEALSLILEGFAKNVAREVLVLLDQRQSVVTPTQISPSLVPRRLSVIDFGVCCNLGAEDIRRKIRSRFIDPKLVEGRPRGTYYIDRIALAKFNVPLEVASERLAARWAQTQRPFAQPSAA